MGYFTHFPEIDYRFGMSREVDRFTDLSRYVDLLDQISDDASTYTYYDVRDGERPDVVATKIYGTADLYWIFPLMNPLIKRHGWPLSYQALLNRLDYDFPGVCIVFFGSATNADTGATQQELVGRYPIGTPVTGLLSGATGVVYDRNPMLGQLFIKDVVGTFVANEAIKPSLIEGYALTGRIIHEPASFAIWRVEDGDGSPVDVDYSSDFRGRPSEGPTDTLGGVFGDPAFPDIYSANSPYRIITHRERYEELNSRLSRLRVLKPQVAAQLPALFRKALQA